MNNLRWRILLIVVIVGACLWAIIPPSQKIRLGLDLKGGLSVILTTEKRIDNTAMDRALLVMQKRVNALGVSEATVQREGNQAILVQLPGVKDAQSASYAIADADTDKYSNRSTHLHENPYSIAHATADVLSRLLVVRKLVELPASSTWTGGLHLRYNHPILKKEV